MKTLLRGDPAYPELLERIAQPPPLLHVIGRLELLAGPAVAIVGTRRPSSEGALFAERLAADLAARGIVVVSGLAYGIDAAAHRGALATGATLAVLASGADVPSPVGNADLYRRIAARGAVVSEFPAGTGARAFQFLQRNRIISGISLGTVVVEAPAKSGALVTARHAAEQDREVFAVPGSPLREGSAGPNALLKDGACLVRGWEDVVRELRLGGDPPASALEAAGGPGQRLAGGIEPGHAGYRPESAPGRGDVLRLLGAAPKHVDELLAESGRGVAELLSELGELEVLGSVRQHPGKFFSRG
ncbi:MAG: DNA-processing protein DprA [Gemmatimonadota bacterium]